MKQQFSNQTIIVTGGGGIGGATCRRFASEGGRVAVFDMNLEAAETKLGPIATPASSRGQVLSVSGGLTMNG